MDFPPNFFVEYSPTFVRGIIVTGENYFQALRSTRGQSHSPPLEIGRSLCRGVVDAHHPQP